MSVNGFQIKENGTEVFRFGYNKDTKKLVAGNIHKGELPNVILYHGDTNENGYLSTNNEGNLIISAISKTISNTSNTSNIVVRDNNTIEFYTSNTKRLEIGSTGNIVLNTPVLKFSNVGGPHIMAMGGATGNVEYLLKHTPDTETTYLGGSNVEIRTGTSASGGDYTSEFGLDGSLHLPNHIMTNDIHLSNVNSSGNIDLEYTGNIYGKTTVPAIHIAKNTNHISINSNLSSENPLYIESHYSTNVIGSFMTEDGSGYISQLNLVRSNTNDSTKSFSETTFKISGPSSAPYDEYPKNALYIGEIGDRNEVVNTATQGLSSVDSNFASAPERGITGEVNSPRGYSNEINGIMLWPNPDGDYPDGHASQGSTSLTSNEYAKVLIGHDTIVSDQDSVKIYPSGRWCMRPSENIGIVHCEFKNTTTNKDTIFRSPASGYGIYLTANTNTPSKFGRWHVFHKRWFAYESNLTVNGNYTTHISSSSGSYTSLFNKKLYCTDIISSYNVSIGEDDNVAHGTLGIGLTSSESANFPLDVFTGVNNSSTVHPGGSGDVNEYSSGNPVNVSGSDVSFGAVYFGAWDGAVNQSGDNATELTGGNQSSFSYTGYTVTADTATTGTTQTASEYGRTSIRCRKATWASGFIATSDSRIKTNIVEADKNKCLEIINQIPLRKYEYIDYIDRGTSEVYGYIAQEANLVLPESVHTKTDYIPDIFSAVSNIEYIKHGQDNETRIILDNKGIDIRPEGLYNNNCVQIYTDSTITVNEPFLMANIINVESNISFTCHVPFSTTVPLDNIWGPTLNSPNIFVYGSLSNDFKTLNKEKISIIHHGAIQCLSDKINQLKIKVNNLQTT